MAEGLDERPVWDDRIVREVRRVREALFAAAGFNLEELCRRLRAEQGEGGRPVVSRPSRPPEEGTGEAA